MTVVVGTTRYTGRAVVRRRAEITTVPAVVHAVVLPVGRTVVATMSVIVSMTSMVVPGMSATIGGIEVRTSEVEIVTVRITQIDAEVPVACLPVERTVEIAGCHKGVPLPVEENIAEVEITTLPVGAEYVGTSCDTHQIVEVDLVGCLVLGIRQVQLVGHLVGEEQGLVAGLLVAHGFGRDSHNHHHCQCE